MGTTYTYNPVRSTALGFSILCSDWIWSNKYQKPSKPRIQRKVIYDNVPVGTAKEFHILAAAQGQELLEAQVGLGIYHFEEELDPDQDHPRL